MALAKKTKKEGNGLDWHETFSGVGLSFFRSFADSLTDKIRHKVQEVIAAIQRGLIGTFLVIVGAIFVLISLVVFLNEIFMLSAGVGYAIVGVFSILVGLLIIKK